MQKKTTRDIYNRPTLIFNYNYNPYLSSLLNIPSRYSLYIFGDLLFDDQEIITARLLKYHIIIRLTKEHIFNRYRNLDIYLLII
jgi:hypothetical protein